MKGQYRGSVTAWPQHCYGPTRPPIGFSRINMSLQGCSCSDMSLTPGKSRVARGISGRNAARYTRISRCLRHVATHARCSDIPYLRGKYAMAARVQFRTTRSHPQPAEMCTRFEFDDSTQIFYMMGFCRQEASVVQDEDRAAVCSKHDQTATSVDSSRNGSQAGRSRMRRASTTHA